MSLGLEAMSLKALQMGINLSAEILGGHWGYKVLDNVINECSEKGASVGGSFGSWIGRNVVGPIIAGGAANDIVASTTKTTAALQTLGQTLFDVVLQKQAADAQMAKKALTAATIVQADGSGIAETE